jgi:TonB family protein
MSIWKCLIFSVLVLVCATSRAQTPSQSAPPPDALQIAPTTLADQVVYKVLPAFPEAAQRLHKAGLAVIQVLIGKDGAVEKILRTDGDPEFVELSKTAALQWTFRPMASKGEPVQVVSLLYFFFRPVGNGHAATVEWVPAFARISGGAATGRIEKQYPPSYPMEAKIHHVSGTVILDAFIGTDGKIEELSVVSGPQVLQASALQAVSLWTYKPYLLNGKSALVEATITVNYALGGGPRF